MNKLIQTLPKNSRILAAVSGGQDSMALLHALAQFVPSHAAKVEVCHIDHGLRSDSSLDVQCVASFATQLGIPLHGVTLEPFPPGENVEAYARTLRYEHFQRLLVERDLEWICTAHTQDDAIETLFMRLVSGKDLRGILEKDERRRCLRPLLHTSRRTIEEYVAYHNIPFREDSTNRDTTRLRNRVRHELIPFLENHFPGSQREVLARQVDLVGELIEVSDHLVQIILGEARELEFGSREWAKSLRESLESSLPALHWRVMEELLFPYLKRRIGRAHALRVLDVLTHQTVGVELPGHWRFSRSGGSFSLVRGESREFSRS
ncbi:MAG: tRNA lysidine(34) synthetase TilS [Bdellovibrionales bacterium]|nr:tRNA lysidine(34) synthetase TilS [Bdellovibrionales bacterium]